MNRYIDIFVPIYWHIRIVISTILYVYTDKIVLLCRHNSAEMLMAFT